MRDWLGRDRVDWRPKSYWKPGTEVTLNAALNGTDSGTGGWFVRDYTTTFTIGTQQIVKVDLDRHRLTLVRDGRTVRRIPVSGGTPGGDKRSWRGTAVLMAKEGTINMNSETVGLGAAYDKMVDYSMRLTWSGMYAHAAPWNARWFGNANRRSGCIGMSDADAAWFYGQVRPGDPFEITGADTKGVVAPENGFGEWDLYSAEWQQRSALRSRVALAYRAERDQPCAFGLERGQALFPHEPGGDPHIEVHPVLGGLAFGDALEEQSRPHTGGIAAGEPRTPVLRGLGAVVIVPSGEPRRRRRYDVPQHLAPEASEPLGFRTVEGDLELLDR
ncbi:hypothetical protein SGLAM104S_09843 [Streptomyces glaucescens]